MKRFLKSLVMFSLIFLMAGTSSCMFYKGTSSLGSYSKSSSVKKSSSSKKSSSTTKSRNTNTNSNTKRSSNTNTKRSTNKSTTTTSTTTTNDADKKYNTASVSATKGATQSGNASYYSDKLHGNTTSSGEKYNKNALTCAHRTLPFGTVVKVTRTDTGASVTCTVNDRGPFKEGRIVDVSGAAATKLDMKTVGICSVKLVVVSVP